MRNPITLSVITVTLIMDVVSCSAIPQSQNVPSEKSTNVQTVEASVKANSAKGGFAEFGKNIELQPGTYTFRLVESTVKYGEQQKISEVALLRTNIETKDAYLTLNGIGDAKTITIPAAGTLSVFFVPGEPTFDDSGWVKVEILRH